MRNNCVTTGRADAGGRPISPEAGAVILNAAIGNVDAHARNDCVLLAPQGPSLAPLYDLMSGPAWAGIRENKAQDIGGQRQGRYIPALDWRPMARAAGIPETATLGRVETLAGQVLEALAQARDEVSAMPAAEGVLPSEFAAQIAARTCTLALNLQAAGKPRPEESGADGDARSDR